MTYYGALTPCSMCRHEASWHRESTWECGRLDGRTKTGTCKCMRFAPSQTTVEPTVWANRIAPDSRRDAMPDGGGE